MRCVHVKSETMYAQQGYFAGLMGNTADNKTGAGNGEL